MILSVLRAHTAALHAKVEQAVDLPARLASLDAYVELLCRFHGIYAPLEMQLAPVVRESGETLDVDSRLKAGLLHDDLRILGRSSGQIAQLPLCRSLPATSDMASAFGCLYVVEGATLGGQVVRNHVHQRYGLDVGTGCSFFSSYQGQIRPMWSEFCEALTTWSTRHPGQEQQIVATAAETFTCFEEWLTW